MKLDPGGVPIRSPAYEKAATKRSAKRITYYSVKRRKGAPGHQAVGRSAQDGAGPTRAVRGRHASGRCGSDTLPGGADPTRFRAVRGRHASGRYGADTLQGGATGRVLWCARPPGRGSWAGPTGRGPWCAGPTGRVLWCAGPPGRGPWSGPTGLGSWCARAKRPVCYIHGLVFCPDLNPSPIPPRTWWGDPLLNVTSAPSRSPRGRGGVIHI